MRKEMWVMISPKGEGWVEGKSASENLVRRGAGRAQSNLTSRQFGREWGEH
jgi:hypothetical protein